MDEAPGSRDVEKEEIEWENRLTLPAKGAKPVGYWHGDESKTVGTTCVLLISYSYSERKDVELIRTEACEADKKNLRFAFKGSNAIVCETSEPLQQILSDLASAKRVRKIFQLNENEAPELFFLFISSHGAKNGVITTHHNELVRVPQVCQALASNPLLSDALKLLFIAKCRGDVHDELLHGKNECSCVFQRYKHSKWKGRALDADDAKNMNAVRVTNENVAKDFVFVHSTVESTFSYRSSEGTSLIRAFCNAFCQLEKNVGLDEFLTRCMFQQHLALDKGCGSTMEVKALRHRRLSLFSRTGIISSFFPTAKLDYVYDWKSDEKISLLARKAFVYASPGLTNTQQVSNLKNSLKRVFGFDVATPQSLDQIKQSVSGSDEVLEGCLLVCIVAPVTKSAKGHLITTVCGKETWIKAITYSSVAPSTGRWIGKPKIFLFLHADDAPDDQHAQGPVNNYRRTEYTRSGTLHSGLLTLVLPQKDSLELFSNTLEEFCASIRERTFQQFFFELLRKSESNEQTKVDPVVVSTLERTLDMSFPLQLYTSSFTVRSSHGLKQKSLSELEEKLLEDGKKRKYVVTVVSADAGSGKSALAHFLADRAEMRRRRVAFVRAKSDWQGLLENSSDLVIVDDYEGGVADEVRHLARDKVPMVLLTTPENVHELKSLLDGTCGVCCVYINKMDEENQVSLLHERLGVGRKKIKAILKQMQDAYAFSLTERVGILEKVAAFPALRDATDVNVYRLCEHVLDAIVRSALGDEESLSVCRRDEQQLLDTLTEYADAHFFGRRDLPEKKLANLGIFRVERNRLVVLNKALATFLFVRKPDFTIKQAKVLPKGEKSAVKIMFKHREAALREDKIVEKGADEGS